ncbi:MAG: hypothetical protein HY060_19420 [Proteobacteria bacterium]|nr:hypothetical protein [Pseudomonadota bacterium]
MPAILNERDATSDGHHTSMLRYATSVAAVLGIAAVAVCGAQAASDSASLTEVAIALAGVWAGTLWLVARREARRLESLPQPASSPRRRCLHGPDDALRPGARLDRVRALVGQFRLQPGALPARRTLDKVRCLRWFARRCRDASVVLAVVAVVVLLAI